MNIEINYRLRRQSVLLVAGVRSWIDLGKYDNALYGIGVILLLRRKTKNSQFFCFICLLSAHKMWYEVTQYNKLILNQAV